MAAQFSYFTTSDDLREIVKHLYYRAFQKHPPLVADASGCSSCDQLCIFSFCTGPTVPHFWRRAVVGRMVHSCGSVSTAHHTSLIPLCWRYDPVYQPSNHHLLSFGRVWSVSSRNGLPTSQLISSTLLGHGAGNGRPLQFCGGGQCVSVDRAEPWHYILAESA